MDSLVIRYVLIKSVRIFHRAVFNAGCAASAFIFYYKPWLFLKNYSEVTCLSFDTQDFSICQHFYVWVPADLDQFR